MPHSLLMYVLFFFIVIIRNVERLRGRGWEGWFLGVGFGKSSFGGGAEAHCLRPPPQAPQERIWLG